MSQSLFFHAYEKAWGETDFLKYENSDNVNDAYSNYIQKLKEIIEKVASDKDK